ncbi:hypothetical protein LINPERPRIM_LOCUS32753 [Linum perenne]
MKQIGLPRFSFDKPSRNSSYTKDDARTDLKQRLLALPYPSELPENLSSVSSSSFVTHKRSSSHGSNMKNPAVSESRNQPSPSKPNPEKKRISNVVAKLMGLEEIPANEDVADVSTEKEASSRKKISGSVLSSLEKGNVNRRNTKDVENLVPPLGRKQKQVMQEKTYALDSGRNSTFQHDGRQIHKDVEGLNPMRGSNMANMKMDKQQSNNVLSQINRFRQDIKKKEWKQNTTEVKGAQNIDDFLEINPLRDQYQKVIISQPLKASEAATTWSAQTELRAEKAQKVATTRRIDELSEKRRGTSPNLSKLKQQASSTLSQKKQRGVDKRLSASKETHREKSGKFNQTKVPLVKSKKSTASIQQADIPEERETRAEEACKLHLQDHLSDDCESLQSPQVQASAENATMIKTDDQDDHQLNSGGNDDGHESRTIITDQIRAHQQVEEKEQKVRQQKKLPEPLTEAENHLKKILVKNQRFVDTAEALFRLNIATDILNVSDSPDCNNEEENKLMIDCSFEVMKRKGKRQEILRRNHNPFTKLTVNCTERESLDGLIGKLYKDLEKLRMYGRKEKAESGIEEYLPKMLEIDVYGSEPDVNSMWEMGWEKVDTAFAQKDEVIKEVEKQVLNGLLDELTGDLLVVF